MTPASGNIRRLGQFSCIAAAQSSGTRKTRKQLSSLDTREGKGKKKWLEKLRSPSCIRPCRLSFKPTSSLPQIRFDSICPLLAGSLVNFDIVPYGLLPAAAFPSALIHHLLEMLLPQVPVVVASLVLSGLDSCRARSHVTAHVPVLRNGRAGQVRWCCRVAGRGGDECDG